MERPRNNERLKTIGLQLKQPFVIRNPKAKDGVGPAHISVLWMPSCLAADRPLQSSVQHIT